MIHFITQQRVSLSNLHLTLCLTCIWNTCTACSCHYDRVCICSWPISYYQYQGNISSRFSSNSEELLENLEEMFPRYYIYKNVQHVQLHCNVSPFEKSLFRLKSCDSEAAFKTCSISNTIESLVIWIIEYSSFESWTMSIDGDVYLTLCIERSFLQRKKS